MNKSSPTPPASGIAKLLTLQQVANITAFSVRQIRRFIDSGALVACRFDRALRVDERDLVVFIASRKCA
jgi:hypothetical protein